MYPSVMTHVETSRINANKRLNHRVQGIDALVGRSGRVGRFAMENDVDPAIGQRAAIHHVAGGRVHHDCRVDIVEYARFGQKDLAATALLRRRAYDLEPTVERCPRTTNRQTGPERTGGNDVVPAAVADLRQSI